jgi:hypothetical protein
VNDHPLHLFERARRMLAEHEQVAFDHDAARAYRWQLSQDVYDSMTAVAEAWADGEFRAGQSRLFGYHCTPDPELPPRSIMFVENR